MNPRGELRALTGARGIAAWFVVLYHIRFAVAGLDPRIVAVLGKGYLGVDFFFLLSGFVIWLSWGERLREGGAARRFLWRRLARIWPLHLFMLGCAVALALLFAATGHGASVLYPWRELPLHALLLQNWGFTDRLAWNEPSWSISTELAAYLAFAVLSPLVDWRRMSSGRIVLAISALAVLLHAVMRYGDAATLGTDIARFGLPRCLVEFACGTAVCALWLRWRDDPVRPAILAGALGTGLLGACAAGLSETLMVPPAFAALLLALALTCGLRGNPLEGAVPHYLGEISYATYLGHFLLFVLFKLAFVDNPRAVPPVLVALYLALVLGSSVALYHLVERPAQDWLNRHGRRGGVKA